jgi:general secretion pathway protein K
MRRLKPRQRPGAAERGIALLIVLGMIVLVTSVVLEFQYNAQVDLKLAYNARDSLQAEYNALSALRMRALLLRQSKKVQGALNAFGLDKSMMPPIGQVLEMIPIDCGLMGAIARRADDPLLETDEEGPGVFAGDCTATSESEHSKISLNVLAKRTGGSDKQVTAMLLTLLMNPAFERHFEEDDLNGTHAESPEELVSAIADWIDRDENETGNQVADEDRHYSYLKDSYRAKNAPFDSLAELQLVHGIDDELYDLLKGHVTIHNDSTQIELATAPIDRIVFGLLMCAHAGVNLLELAQHPGLTEAVLMIQEMRMLGGAMFGALKVQGLVGLLQQYGLDAVIDTAQVSKVFTDKQGSTWYTIRAQGQTGNATRRISAVFQASEGQFYYVRLE